MILVVSIHKPKNLGVLAFFRKYAILKITSHIGCKIIAGSVDDEARNRI